MEFFRRVQRAFQSERRTTGAELASWRERYAHHRLSGVLDGGRLVATYHCWDAPVIVPGGSVVTDMITSVSVDPTRRRRGMLRAMVLADLRRARQAGTVMAMLGASEAAIYGRFGFGHALSSVDWRVDLPAGMAAVLPPGTGEVEVALVEDGDLVEVAPRLYAVAAAGQPGAIAVDATGWDVTLGTVEVPGQEAERLRPALLARLGGEVVGYARYRLPESFENARSTCELAVGDLVAATPAALAALWRQLLGIDLVATIKAAHRPVGDLLPELLADRRRAVQTGSEDACWVRLLDVPAALTARRYCAPVDAVVEVGDPLGFSSGRWRVTVSEVADGGGSNPSAPGLPAKATATDAAPDLVLDVATLSATYLGETPLTRLHAAGRVVEHTPGLVRRLGAALAWEPTTSPTVYGF